MRKHLLQHSRLSAACSTMNTQSLIPRGQVGSDILSCCAHDIPRWEYEVSRAWKQAVRAWTSRDHQKHCFPCKETPLIFRVHQLPYGTQHELKKRVCIRICPSRNFKKKILFKLEARTSSR